MFVDDDSPLDMLFDTVSAKAPPPTTVTDQARAAARRRMARPEASRPRPPAPRPTPPVDAGRSLVAAIGAVVRLAILFAFGYVALSLWAMPEVKDVVVAFVRGERPDLQPLLARFAEWLNP